VQADYAVELGADDEALEMPWSACEQGLQYYDLKRHPELLNQIQEAQQVPELGGFLAAINSAASSLETAKCEVWFSTDINPEEEIFAAPVKFGCYVDLLFSEERRRFSLSDHQNLAQNSVDLLRREPEIPAVAEFLIRRCYYLDPSDRTQEQTSRDGFYITFYLFGYDSDEESARRRWAGALKLAENALLQLAPG
jgi:hypothetical protein